MYHLDCPLSLDHLAFISAAHIESSIHNRADAIAESSAALSTARPCFASLITKDGKSKAAAYSPNAADTIGVAAGAHCRRALNALSRSPALLSSTPTTCCVSSISTASGAGAAGGTSCLSCCDTSCTESFLLECAAVDGRMSELYAAITSGRVRARIASASASSVRWRPSVRS